jgi:hypothetical protein
MALVILFSRSSSVMEEREFNTEGTKQSSRRTRSDRETCPLCVLRVQAPEPSDGYVPLGTLC